MTATVAAIEHAVVAALAAGSDLRGWTYLPDNFSPPCALVAAGDIDYHGSFGQGDVPVVVSVLVIVARSSDRVGQAALDAYRSYEGTNSVRAAIETDRTLGGVVYDSLVEKSGPHVAISINGAEYLAVEFTLTVHA